jgi:hypothetical protein
MNWTQIIIVALICLPASVFFKYGFMAFSNYIYHTQQTKVVKKVIEEHGQYIADGIIEIVAARTEAVQKGSVAHDNNKSAVFQASRRSNNKES